MRQPKEQYKITCQNKYLSKFIVNIFFLEFILAILGWILKMYFKVKCSYDILKQMSLTLEQERSFQNAVKGRYAIAECNFSQME